MGRAAVLCVTLMASFCSLGSLFQTPHSLGIFDSFRTSQSRNRNINDVNDVTREDSFHSESFVEGSGYVAGDVKSPQLNTESAILKESEQQHSGSGILLRKRPALGVHSSEGHSPGADTADSFTGDSHTSGLSEETDLDNSHLTDKQLQGSHSSSSLTGE